MDDKIEPPYESLNAAQKLAVDQINGPVLVVAGAGTGKTRVIVERIQRLILSGVRPDAILALTFTEKAAAEMLDRLNASKTGITTDSTISTFNRFGNDLIEAYGSEWGLGKLRLLGDTGQLVFLREHFDEFELDYFAPVSNPDSQLEKLLGYVSLLKQQLVAPEAYHKYAKSLPSGDEAEHLDMQKHQELARFFATYIKLCRREQVIDYDDQIYLGVKLLEARPNVLRELQKRYQFVLVDEFQDTNPMQSKLVDMLAGLNQNIMVVGDDDQSIYGWRGATLANILDFKLRYPKVHEITLTRNYRSSQPILDSAYRLIQHNNPNRLEVMNKLDKRLRGQKGGYPPLLKHFVSFDAELAWLAEAIQSRLTAGQAPGSIAILARRNHGIQKIHEALELYDVPHKVAGLNNDLYTQNAVRQLIEALKAVGNPLDNMALFHTLNGPLFRLDINLIAELAAAAQREHQTLTEIIRASDNDKINTALGQLEDWRQQASQQSVGNLAYAIITDSGWKQQLYDKAADDAISFNEVQALAKFFKTLKEFERIASVASVQNYLVNLPVLQAAGSQFEDVTLDISGSEVNLLSIHRAKGLEWDTVYISDCTEGSFPLKSFGGALELPPELQAHPSAADDSLAEERRLMYVALTRGRHDVILSFADRHGSGALRKPSRFITELLGHEPLEQAEDEVTQTSLEFLAPQIQVQTASVVALPGSMMRDGRLVLSVSQIDCWLRCPQDFYYKYILNMPLPPAPQLGYGSLIHGIIERIHEARRASQSLPSLEELTREVVDNLPRAGYQSKLTRERAVVQATRTVKIVYDRFMNDELPLETELPFSMELADLPLNIRGRIDAVYQMEKGVEIRDFKTGTSIRSAEQAKSRATGSQQLTLYALAWRQLHGEMPAQLSLDFVETGQIGSVKKQPKSLDSLTTKLETMASQLKAGQYPTGQDHSRCLHPIDN